MPKKTFNEYRLENAEHLEQLDQLRAIIKAIDPDGALVRAVGEKLYNEHPAFARLKAHTEAYNDLRRRKHEAMQNITQMFHKISESDNPPH